MRGKRGEGFYAPLFFNMKLICFDLDNTLINSDRAHYRAYNIALKKLGFKKLSYGKMIKHFGAPKIEIAMMLTSSNDEGIINKITELHENLLVKEAKKDARKIAGVETTLKNLKKKYGLGLLSNNSHNNIIQLLKAVKLDRNLFDVVIGNDDVKYSKPYPDEILKAEKLLHLKASYMVGDSIYDIMAGKKAGVKTIAVLTGHYSKNALKRYNPDYIVKSLNGIFKILKLKTKII